jgi:hypothetical protein
VAVIVCVSVVSAATDRALPGDRALRIAASMAAFWLAAVGAMGLSAGEPARAWSLMARRDQGRRQRAPTTMPRPPLAPQTPSPLLAIATAGGVYMTYKASKETWVAGKMR